VSELVTHPSPSLDAFNTVRVLMARADKLSQQVKTMSARIRQLEAALADAQASHSDAHPLLTTAVKWEEEDEILPSDNESEDNSNGNNEVRRTHHVFLSDFSYSL
jgi:hypothetical protein